MSGTSVDKNNSYEGRGHRDLEILIKNTKMRENNKNKKHRKYWEGILVNTEIANI